jgi:rare lipoprotein A
VTPAGAAAAVKAARPDAVPADDESATEFQGDPDALPPMPRPAPLKGSCNGGRRIISAFYWEGTHTASGQRFDPNGMTAAHRTLPFGTQLTVGNPRTGKTVIVTINDRGPYVSGVSLDLSRGAAKAIGLQGTGAVCIL